jgi:hypothetical protein
MKTRTITILAALASLVPLMAQDVPTPPAKDEREQVLDNIIDKARLGVGAQSSRAFRSASDPSNTTDFIRYFRAAVAAAKAGAVKDNQNNQTEHQGGSSAASSGSSALVQKGGISQILSLAVDNGGLQRETSGTTVTFRGRPLGLIQAFKQYDLFGVLSSIETDDSKKFFDKFSFAVAFDTNRGGVQNTLLANSQQLQTWSIRAEIINQRDAKSRRYAKLWTDVSGKHALKVGDAEAKLLREYLETAWDEFRDWRTKLEALGAKYDQDLKDHPDLQETLLKKFRVDVKAMLDQVPSLPNRPKDLDTKLAKVTASWKDLDADAQEVVDYVQKGQLLTFDWTTKRDPFLPDLYLNTLIYETSLWKSRTDDFTFNASVNWYRVAPKQPAGAGQFKDFNAVGQYDIPLGNL